MVGWLWLWLLFVLVLLVAPLGYGWGYRGWGPPYPTYLRRRRTDVGAGGAVGPAGTSDPMLSDTSAPESRMQTDVGWGWAADVMWLVLLVAVIWFIVAMTWY